MIKQEIQMDSTQNKKSIPIYEQETHIYWMRDEPFANIYSSDTTQITRLDKLCIESPDSYQLVQEDQYSKTYKCNKKSLISLRKSSRTMTEQQKRKAAERMRNLHIQKRKKGEDET